jgi:hypothetical protein
VAARIVRIVVKAEEVFMTAGSYTAMDVIWAVRLSYVQRVRIPGSVRVSE